MRGWPALLSALMLSASLAAPAVAHAAPAQITYHYKHFLFTLSPSADWKTLEDRWTYEGQDIVILPEEHRGSGAVLPEGIERHTVPAWNRTAIAASIQKSIADKFNREARTVTIDEKDGKVVFDGVGLPGRAVNVEDAVTLTIVALEQDINSITLPVTEIQPKVTVLSENLRQQGIREVVTVGESDYSNSPANRRHNIAVGISRFDGHIVKKDEVFSFDAILGPVGPKTGFLKELVILGDKTVPDYGGGLCQVSTTAYRGVWEYGFPIVQRQNHSFAVSHYLPQGTDATIYPPNVDMKFKNDSPGSLLMQTLLEDDLAYFIYYGTKDNRESEVIGPYIWARVSAPPERREETHDLPPGELKKVGEAVAGMKAQWFRIVKQDGKENLEKVFSSYQARPRYYLVGAADAPATDGLTDEALDPLQ